MICSLDYEKLVCNAGPVDDGWYKCQSSFRSEIMSLSSALLFLDELATYLTIKVKCHIQLLLTALVPSVPSMPLKIAFLPNTILTMLTLSQCFKMSMSPSFSIFLSTCQKSSRHKKGASLNYRSQPTRLILFCQAACQKSSRQKGRLL